MIILVGGNSFDEYTYFKFPLFSHTFQYHYMFHDVISPEIDPNSKIDLYEINYRKRQLITKVDWYYIFIMEYRSIIRNDLKEDNLFIYSGNIDKSVKEYIKRKTSC